MNKKIIFLVLFFYVHLSAMEIRKRKEDETPRYDQMTHLATNKASAIQGPTWKTFWSVDAQCQDLSILEQLQKGARALVLSIGKVKEEEVHVFNRSGHKLPEMFPTIEQHAPYVNILFSNDISSFFDPAATTLEEVLTNVEMFMKKIPNERVTLF